MFVRTQGFLAISAAVLGVACSDPVLPSDLRADGPPEVLAVLVMNDPASGLEAATFCKTQGPNDGAQGAGDDKRPTLVDGPNGGGTVQVCPDDLTMDATEVTDAVPTGWYVRLMFDELLDPNVEELVPITDSSGMPTGNSAGSLANTQPVTLSCGGVDVPYDGYYQPSGNALTWPLGPSLFIQANDPTSVATGTECTVTIKTGIVLDKDGNDVPADQLGPYKFAIGALAVTSVTPTAGVTDPTMRDQVDPSTPISITFNDVIDPTSITAADIQLFSGAGSDCTGGAAVTPLFFQAGDGMGGVADPTSIQIYDSAAPAPKNPDPTDPTNTGNLLVPSTTYRLVFPAGASATDIAGGTGPIAFPDDAMGNPVTELCFDTTAAM